METLSTFLTPMVAIATIMASIAAFYQWRINRFRLKVELYDRIKQIFDSTEKLFSKIVANYSLHFNQALEFRQETSAAKFILKGKALKHIEELRSKAMLLAQTCDKIETLGNSDRNINHLINEKEQLMDWFHKQPNITERMFKKYLDIRK